MADQQLPAPGSSSDTDGEGSPPPAPRWVKVFGLIAVVLVLLFVIRHLAGGGFRGHMAP